MRTIPFLNCLSPHHHYKNSIHTPPPIPRCEFNTPNKIHPHSRKRLVSRSSFTSNPVTEIDESISEITEFADDDGDDEGVWLEPDLTGFLASRLQCCSTIKELKSLHSLIEKATGAKSDVFIGNNLISQYARFRRLEHAHQVFDEMPKRDFITWTALIDGFTNNGEEDDVFVIFDDMLKDGMCPNSRTYACVLSACARRLDLELGKQVHACVVKGKCSNLIVDSALIKLYTECEDLSTAWSVFKRMRNYDVVSWTTMITGCVQFGQTNKAMSLFHDMQREGMQPNEFTVCSLLKACADEKTLKHGKQLHAAIVKGVFKDDVFTGSSLVFMYAKCGKASNARTVFNRMRGRNTVTWTSMIAGYAQNGLGNEAIELFRYMRSRRVAGNDMTIVAVLSACGANRSSHHGKEVHGQILKKGVQNNMYISSTLVWLYCRCDLHDYASNVLELMNRRDVTAWTAMISGCTNQGYAPEALRYMNYMLLEGVYPNQFTYSSALKACAGSQSVRHGQVIHASANKVPGLFNAYVGSALIGMYAKCGNIVDASKVFDTMMASNVVPWKAMIIGYVRNGQRKEAMKLMLEMKERGIEVDDFVLSSVLTAWDEESFERESMSSTI